MQRIGQKFSAVNSIPENDKKASLAGKWNQWTRIFIAKVDGKFQTISANMLERFVASFLKIFNVNYFKIALGAKEVKILTREELNATDKKAPPVFAKSIPPAVKPNPALVQVPYQQAAPALPRVPVQNIPQQAAVNVHPAGSPPQLQAAPPQAINNAQQLPVVQPQHVPAPQAINSPQQLPGAQPQQVPAPQAINNPQQLPAVPAQQLLPVVPQQIPPAAAPANNQPNPQEMQELQNALDNHIAVFNSQDLEILRGHLLTTFHPYGPAKLAQVNWFIDYKIQQAVQQAARPPQQAPVAALFRPDFDALPQAARPLDFVLAPNGLSQYNREGDRYKSACALMSAAYLVQNKEATPQSIEEAIRSPRVPPPQHLDLGDDQVIRYAHPANRLDPIPAQNIGGMNIYDHTIMDGDWPQFLQNQLDGLFNPTGGCLLLRNSKTYCIRRKNDGSNQIEFFDSHGYSQLTGKNGGFVATFRDLRHLKEFLTLCQPLQPIPGGQPGYALVFAKAVKK